MSTLMPISRAASGSCAVARIARPMRLWLMNVVSSRTSGIVVRDREHVALVHLTPPIEKRSFCGSTSCGTPSCEPPIQRMPTFWRMNDMPTAVISGASLGADLSGR